MEGPTPSSRAAPTQRSHGEEVNPQEMEDERLAEGEVSVRDRNEGIDAEVTSMES